MADLKRKVDLAELKVATDLLRHVPAAELGTGRSSITLRLGPTRNNQRVGIRMATDYETIR